MLPLKTWKKHPRELLIISPHFFSVSPTGTKPAQISVLVWKMSPCAIWILFFNFFPYFFFVYLFVKMFKSISSDSVWSGRTCPANLGVRSCLVRKFICPVWLSLKLKTLIQCFIYLVQIFALSYTCGDFIEIYHRKDLLLDIYVLLVVGFLAWGSQIYKV